MRRGYGYRSSDGKASFVISGLMFSNRHVEIKSKEKTNGSRDVCSDFPEVFPDELPGLPALRLVKFQIDVVSNFLGHVIDRSGVYVDPAKIEAIKSWAALTTPMEVRQFLRLAGYYRRLLAVSCVLHDLSIAEGRKISWCLVDAVLEGLIDASPEEDCHRVKNRLLAARSRQKSYADKRLKPLEFEVGDMVLLKIIMVNEIHPDHVDDVPVVEPNQHDDDERVDMEIDIKEDENEPKLTYPYEEVDPLNPSPPASESEPDNEIEVKNPIEYEDETVPVSVYEMAYALVEKKSKAKDRFYGKLILYLGNEVRSSMEQGTTAMEKLVEKLENVEEKAECKKLKKELEEARLSNTFLRMQNERVERDLYWTRVRAHEFYQEMIRKGFVFEERPNEVIDVPIEDEKSPLSEPGPGTCYWIYSMRGQDTTPAICDCTFVGFMNCNPTIFHGIEGAIELQRWFEKTESVFGISECAEGKKTEIKQLMTTKFCPIEESHRLENELWNLKVKEYDIVAYTQRFNELALMCPRMVKPGRVKVDAYIRGLTDNIKGEVTSSKPTNLSKAIRMAHKLMEQKSQARNERSESRRITKVEIVVCCDTHERIRDSPPFHVNDFFATRSSRHTEYSPISCDALNILSYVRERRTATHIADTEGSSKEKNVARSHYTIFKGKSACIGRYKNRRLPIILNYLERT
ncbi:reverse transcriptase domain-containing protein [Tanacetum coccineum]